MDAAVIYAAKSTEDEKDSIKSQLAEIREAIEREGERTIIGEFSDENVSAFRKSRGPGLAAAIAEAKASAPCELWGFDPDRLARGDGREARHLGGLYFDLLADGVALRAVNGDDDLKDAIRVVLRGERNHQDSAAKSAHTKRGLRAAVERGGWRGGTVPEGYEVLRELDARGRKMCTVVKGDDAEKFELLWAMALDGKSALAISLEFDRRGYVTRAARKDRKPQPFTLRRIGQTLDCPFYAGLQAWGGELFPGAWPRYIEPEDLHRLKAERKSHPHKKPAPPVSVEYLLKGLAICGVCGAPARAITSTKTGRRTYVCGNHRDHHRDSPHWCPAKPWDAVERDRRVLAAIENLMLDADALRRQMVAGQNAERDKRDAEVTRAQEQAAEAEKQAERAEADYRATTDETERGIALRAARAARLEAEKTGRLIDAVLDAREQEPDEADPQEVMARLWEALGGQLDGADGDVAVMNAALRESFDAFVLDRNHVSARVSGAALWRHAQVRVNRPPFKLYPHPAPLLLA
jgi:DNA invertase Pin-like site-specific DNA recombinase